MDYRHMKVTVYKPGEEGGLAARKKGKQKESLGGRRLDGYWWCAQPEQLASAVATAGRTIEAQQEYRSQANLRHARIYGYWDMVGFGPRDYSASRSDWTGNTTSWNAVAACADTLHSKLAKSKPRSSFQTFGGDWGLQRKALKLDKFTQGIFYQAKTYQHSQAAAFDGILLGTGIVQVYEDVRHRIRHERIFPDELLIDDADGKGGCPRQALRRKDVARELVMAEYGRPLFANEPRKEVEARCAAILAASPLDYPRQAGPSFGDQIRVWEAWHLPSGPELEDGLHVIAIDGAVLFQEPWKKEHFGLAFYRYTKPPLGFWGRGMGERLWGIQCALNRNVREIAECLRLVSKPKWLVEESADVNVGHIRGGAGAIGDVLKYTRQKPEVYTPQAVAPEHFQEREELWRKAFEQEGVSPQEATATKPAGLDSAVAQREYNDIASERHAIKGQDWEQFHLDIAELSIELAKEIAKREGDYEATAPIRKVLYPVKWSEIELEKDAYVMQAFPVSSLPTTPAARTQMVDEWVQRGWVSAEEAPRLMNMPDLDETVSLESAALDDVDAAIDEILEGGEAEPVDEFENPQLRIQRGMAAYFRAKRQGAPSEVLWTLHEFVKLGMDAVDLRAKVVATSQPAAPASPTALPQAAPPSPGGAPQLNPLAAGGVPPAPTLQ